MKSNMTHKAIQILHYITTDAKRAVTKTSSVAISFSMCFILQYQKYLSIKLKRLESPQNSKASKSQLPLPFAHSKHA